MEKGNLDCLLVDPPTPMLGPDKPNRRLTGVLAAVDVSSSSRLTTLTDVAVGTEAELDTAAVTAAAAAVDVDSLVAGDLEVDLVAARTPPPQWMLRRKIE